MSFQKLVSYGATNSADAIIKIKDQMLLMGWTMHDDQSGAGNPYYILKSYGEDTTAEIPVYIMVGKSTRDNKIYWRMFLYWNNVTHSGVVEMGTTTDCEIYSNDDSSFYMWIYGCKDYVIVITKIGSTYYGNNVTRCNTLQDSNIGELQSNSGTGTDKVLQLGSGEASTFISGRNTALVCIDGTTGRQYDLTISDVDRDNDTITISSDISYDFPAGSLVGHQPFPWMIGKLTTSGNYSLQGTGTSAQTGKSRMEDLFPISYFKPDELTGLYGLIPIYYNKTSSDFFGIVEKGYFSSSFTDGSYEDTISTELRSSGTVTSSSSNTIDSTGHNWITNEFVGKAITITTGTGIGQIRDIISNTDEQIIVDENWNVNPAVDDNFVISDRAYRHFGWFFSIAVQECGDMGI